MKNKNKAVWGVRFKNPTTILINKEGEEFARIIGSINFQDNKFLKWLSSYD